MIAKFCCWLGFHDWHCIDLQRWRCFRPGCLEELTPKESNDDQ